ncbi:tyrosine-type recombinase/integrase [Salinibacter ruber]|uniref:tyrosine-type recombinase/integrase n=1 Tax=Salinibacter ruber TaxID=146919 RepID=UPI0021672C46|nr:site-specific integrase [Salinibacter ruber]MCS4102366.1 integrase [Salinibacter ruber]
MASIFDRSGKYYAQFYDSDRSPNRKRFSLRTSNRKEARRRLTDFERAYENGDFDPWTDDPFAEDTGEEETDGPSTVGEAIEAFCEAKREQGRTDSTIRNYRKQWRLFARRVGKETALDDLESDDVRSFVYDRDVKATTGANRYRHVGAILRWKGHESIIDAVEKPKTGEKLPKAVRPDELRSICRAAVKDYREKRRKNHCRPREIVWIVPAIRFAYFTGLRGSELARVRWSHVDLDRQQLTIYRQKSGDESTIPLVKHAREILRRLYDGEYGDTFVFRSPRCDPTERSARRFREHVSRKFAEYRDEAGLRQQLTLHSLRHGFGTRLAENGASAIAIKRAMRHSDISTSMRYVHMANERLQSEVESAFA